MTTLERLNRVRSNKVEYERLVTRVEELEAIATKTTSFFSDTPEVHSGNSLKDDAWARLMDYKAKLGEQMTEYLRSCTELEQELDCIRSPRIRTAMKYRYVDGYSIAKIEGAMCYETRQIQRLLRTGENIYYERYRNEET